MTRQTAGDEELEALRGDGNDAVLTVEDKGVGISPDLLPVKDRRDARLM